MNLENLKKTIKKIKNKKCFKYRKEKAMKNRLKVILI